MYRYKTFGTCSSEIRFDVDEQNRLRNVQIIGGCRGNTQGVCRLCEGRDIDDVEKLLKGILCRNGTSCPDQLSRAIAKYKSEKDRQ